MDELKNAFYEVMYKYASSFGEAGVMANLNGWAEGKAGLLTLLRTHPDWNEDEKAIIYRFTEGRTIDRDVVDEATYGIESIADEMLHGSTWDRFTTALSAAVSEYASTLSEPTLEVIRANSEVKCVVGQKTSRIIGRLCREYRLDTHKQYNSAFARLADSLNPIEIKKTAVLSLHPCDFLEMSNRDDVWHSCHCLADGRYRSGCLSYLCDTVTMVFYTVDNEVTDHFYRYPKLTRELFFFKDNLLFQSRLYPQDFYEPMEQYRSLVQKTISVCLGVPNLWTFHEKRPDINKVYSSADNSTNYPDYEYYGNLSVLKGTEIHSIMEIGSQPRCVCCGRLHDNTSRLICDCDATVVCKDCGETVLRRDATYEDGAFFCKTCLHMCAVCGEKSHGTMYPAINKKGELISVCRNCYLDSVNICSTCRVRALCSIIGCSFLCPNTAVYIGEEGHHDRI